MPAKIILFFCSLLIAGLAFGQSVLPKKVLANRLKSGTIKIDGNLDESFWKEATKIDSFTEWRPAFGMPEKAESRTEVYLLYDNANIYVGGYCHEKTIDSISKELAGRDKVGSNDFIGIIFDPYYDKINASGFYVMASGEQYDAKYSMQGEDDTWNAVWFAETKIHQDGWSFEMRIPYAALRFSPKVKTWGMNITRKRVKSGKQYMWNPVNPNINGFISQEGLLTGLSDIKPPIRLSFSPYFSSYLNYYPYNNSKVNNTTTSINGGMDIKYGINQNYTLDMTLIPDFGQVQSDKIVDNLTPFEVKYDENRSFFTEGTELFNKGNYFSNTLFYSRRIGGAPLHQYDIYGNLAPHEWVVENPTESKLLNATKISGRNSKGLGIGFFNAITKPMYAIIEDTLLHTSRKEEVAALTNYNILVLDKTLKNNSSVTFINTNTLRNGKDYDANVSFGSFDMYTKGNKFNYFGGLAISKIFSNATHKTGYYHVLGIGVPSGKLNFSIIQELADDKFDANDMGLMQNNNYLNHNIWIGRKWIKPTRWYNSIYLNYNNNFSHNYKNKRLQNYNTNINANGQLKNLWQVGFNFSYRAPGNDFYEARMPGRVFKLTQQFSQEIWGQTNSAKKYLTDFDITYKQKKLFHGDMLYLGWGNRYRFNDKFSLSSNFTVNWYHNDAGYAGYDNLANEIVFSRRDRKVVDNSFSVKYNFSKKAGLNLTARHYWSWVKAKEIYNLNNEGSLQPGNSSYPNDWASRNLNLFNIDMAYSLEFAPGSFLNLVWKNAIVDRYADLEDTYFKNFSHTLASAQNNNISIKLLYYFDYLSLKKHK